MDALAVATAALAAATIWLALESRQASYRYIGVRTWLELERRFDSEEMKRARKKLAQQLKAYEATQHVRVSETVLNFFESVGTAHRLKRLNKQLARSSFGFYACRWWEAARSYIDRERKRHNEDETLFEDFEDLASQMRSPDEKIDSEELQRFLEDESKLIVD